MSNHYLCCQCHWLSSKHCDDCRLMCEGPKASISRLNRLEVIDETGRAYVRGSIYGDPISIELDYQDDGRTLKVFVTPQNQEEAKLKEKSTE